MDDAARECYEKHVDELLRFASTLAGPSGADDLVSSTFLRVLTGDHWRTVEDVRSYLYTAVLNQARDQHRSTQRRLRREARAARVAAALPPTVRPEVLDAIRQLSLRQRAVVFLTYWEDADAQTVAARLRISRQTVDRDLAAARSTLKGLLT
ncbi:MAG: sigma-70 family RNA polymerase sigma factor [Ilumatobacteraceae bacterium]